MGELAEQIKISEQLETLNRQLARGGGAPRGGAARTAAVAVASRAATSGHASRAAAPGHASGHASGHTSGHACRAAAAGHSSGAGSPGYPYDAAVSSARLANMAGLARPIFRSREPFGVG